MQEAVDRGLFRQETSVDAQPNMATILTTALEVASAMAFLHEHGIVHGDLTGGDRPSASFIDTCNPPLGDLTLS